MRHLITSSLIVLAFASAGFGQQSHRQDVRQTLQQVPAGQHTPQQVAAWWSDRTAGLVGGIAGSVLGCLGGLIGTLGGLGKARRFVLGLMKVIVWLGAATLVTGVVALVQSQPYAVWYPLLLLGTLSVVIVGPLQSVMRHGYQQRELRKMTAMDATAGRASGVAS